MAVNSSHLLVYIQARVLKIVESCFGSGSRKKNPGFVSDIFQKESVCNSVLDLDPIFSEGSDPDPSETGSVYFKWREGGPVVGLLKKTSLILDLYLIFKGSNPNPS